MGLCHKTITANVTLVGCSVSHAPLTWLFQVRGEKLVHFIPPSPLRPLFGFVLQTLNHEVLQLNETESG